MTKKYLPFVLLFIALFCSCQSETKIESTPPTGVWEELIWVPVLEESGKVFLVEKTFDEIPAEIKDTSVFMATRITFISADQLEMTIRYCSGKRTPEKDSLDCYTGPVRIDYVRGTYSIKDGLNILGEDMRSIHLSGAFVGESTPDPSNCSSVGDFIRVYDFTYEDSEKKHLRMGYSDSTRVNIQNFRQL